MSKSGFDDILMFVLIINCSTNNHSNDKKFIRYASAYVNQ